jgi:pimeloyl-ACP methyl ester carboxylesterase
MSQVLILLICILVILAGLTFWRSRRVDNRFVPDGSINTVDGVRLHHHYFPVSEQPSELPTLVFLHGASGNAYDSRLAFQKAFEGRYPLLFLDRPGLGFSERNEARHGHLEGQAKLIADWLGTLDIDNAVIVGHSLGGAVTAALGLAAGERVKGLAFLAPVTHPWPGGVNWYYSLASWPLLGNLFCQTLVWPAAELFAPRAIANAFHPDAVPEDYAGKIRLPLLFRPEVFRANARDVTGLKKAVSGQSQRYSTLEQPSLVVTGTNDTVVWPSIHCEGLLKELPDVELLMLDGAGHMPHHTHTPQIVSGLERLINRVREKNQDASDTHRTENSHERA